MRVDLKLPVKTIEMIARFLRGDLKKIGVTMENQKPAFPKSPEAGGHLAGSTPEAQGISSWHLARFFAALSASARVRPHSVVVLRHGKVIAKAAWKPYDLNCPMMAYSLSKSVTATAIGMLVDEGSLSLDSRIVDLLGEAGRGGAIRRQKTGQITVRHLLTMSSGSSFNESSSMVAKDWVRGFIEADVMFVPGARFVYNSMNTYMLSAIVKQLTGAGLVDYLTPRLFEPLGIKNFHWEKCPMGIEKGGWGLYLLPEDMAKIGQLYLDKGVWKEFGEPRRLLSEDWVREATSAHIFDEENCRYGYGYQIWRCPIEGAYQFNGAFGQHTFVLPHADMVITVTSGSAELFGLGETIELIAEYFGGDRQIPPFSLPQDKKGKRELLRLLSELDLQNRQKEKDSTVFKWFKKPEKTPAASPALQKMIFENSGRRFYLSQSLGSIVPFVLQTVHSNFSSGIRELKFDFEKDFYRLEVLDGEETCVIEAGINGRWRESVITLRGETYRVASAALWETDLDMHASLKLYCAFIETPHIRTITASFYEDVATFRFDESPSVARGMRMIYKLAAGYISLPPEKLAHEMFTALGTKNKVRQFAVPCALGYHSGGAGQNPFDELLLI